MTVVTSALKALRASIVRTYAPMAVTLIVHLAAVANLDLGEDRLLLTNAVAFVIDSVVGMAYYTGARLLELFKASRWGRWLLGFGVIKAAPVYAIDPDPATPATQAGAVVVPPPS